MHGEIFPFVLGFCYCFFGRGLVFWLVWYGFSFFFEEVFLFLAGLSSFGALYIFVEICGGLSSHLKLPQRLGDCFHMFDFLWKRPFFESSDVS